MITMDKPRLIIDNTSENISAAVVDNGDIENNETKPYASSHQVTHGGETMSDISRTEFDAKLGQNKAEVDSVAASMRADMAQWREQNNTQMSSLQADLRSLNAKIDGKFEGLSGKFEGIDGKIDGLKSSISTMQWMTGSVLAFLALIAAVVAIPGIDKLL